MKNRKKFLTAGGENYVFITKAKTIKEQDGQMLLCHSTHIVMTKEVAETEMHAAKRLQEAIRQETGLILPFSVGEVREGISLLGSQKHYQSRHMRSRSTKKADRFQAATGWRALWCGDLLPDRTAVWRDTALCTDSGCPGYAKPWLLF